MLSHTCREFRERFEPGRDDPHRGSCAECAAFAEALESRPRRPLPESLHRKLRAIPERTVVCRDVDRLYGTTLEQAAGNATNDSAAARHLQSCGRCRRLYGTLRSAMESRRRTLPGALAYRLRSLARQPEHLLPVWITDARYATAACWLLAGFLALFAGDAAALFRDSSEVVSSHTTAWAERGEEGSQRLWEAAAVCLEDGLGKGREKIELYGAPFEVLFFDTLQLIETTRDELTIEPLSAIQGEPDGRP